MPVVEITNIKYGNILAQTLLLVEKTKTQCSGERGFKIMICVESFDWEKQKRKRHFFCGGVGFPISINLSGRAAEL